MVEVPRGAPVNALSFRRKGYGKRKGRGPKKAASNFQAGATRGGHVLHWLKIFSQPGPCLGPTTKKQKQFASFVF
jgi:hypothetical protein